MKDFPIPVVAQGFGVGIDAGSQTEDEHLDYLPMPGGMDTFRAPLLPEPEEIASRAGARAALARTLTGLQQLLAGQAAPRTVSLQGLGAEDLALVNQVLGEGEVSAVVHQDGAADEWRVQESVFAGVWRVLHLQQGQVLADHIEVGAVPQVLLQAAADDADPAMPAWAGPLPPNVQNAPALLVEIEAAFRAWQPGEPAEVVNLSLLPVSVEDIGFLDHHLGTGRVLILSRGYGNCRITNSRRPNTWRVVYYNSQDVVILNTVEVGPLPEVACAAPEDLADSAERLHEVLQWVDGEAA